MGRLFLLRTHWLQQTKFGTASDSNFWAISLAYGCQLWAGSLPRKNSQSQSGRGPKNHDQHRAWMHRMAIRKALPAGQRENHIDRRLHFHRLAIEKVGLVAKLLHSFERGSGQHRVSADHVQVLDGTVLADHGLKHDRALNTRLAGQRRILRLHLMDQQSLRYALRHAHTLRGHKAYRKDC